MLANFAVLGRNIAARGPLSNRRTAWKVAAAGLSALALASVAACGSSGGSSDSSGSSGSSAQGANVAAAKANLAPYTVAPTTFPVADPLSAKLPAGKKFVYLQCGTPICAVVGVFIKQAVGAIGGTLTVVNAGTTAQTAQAAASSALALKPDAVLLGAIDPALFGTGLKKLADGGAKLVSLQIDKDVQPFGITFNYLGTNLSQRNGKLLADWVIANKGAKANAVFYSLPALDISAPVQSAFEAEMKANCSSCKVRVVPLDARTIGSTAPRTIVTDLQVSRVKELAGFWWFEMSGRSGWPGPGGPPGAGSRPAPRAA